jgi:hypothetical protein
MNRTTRRVGISIAVLAAASLLSATPGYSQTQGMERRQNRRQNRDDARGTRQEGRHDARDAKQECKDAGGNRIDCRRTLAAPLGTRSGERPTNRASSAQVAPLR